MSESTPGISEATFDSIFRRTLVIKLRARFVTPEDPAPSYRDVSVRQCHTVVLRVACFGTHSVRCTRSSHDSIAREEYKRECPDGDGAARGVFIKDASLKQFLKSQVLCPIRIGSVGAPAVKYTVPAVRERPL
eukprot:6492306-Amphidinium_carterae.2